MGLPAETKANKLERARFAMKNGADLNEAARRVGLTPAQLDKLLWSGIGGKSESAIVQQERAIRREEAKPKRGPQPRNEGRNATIVVLRKCGATPAEIAEHVGVSRSVVAGVLHRAGLTDSTSHKSNHAPRPRAGTPERDARVVAAYLAGKTMGEVGEAEGVCHHTVACTLKRMGVKPRKRGFGSMTPERRQEIARMGGAAVPPEMRSFSQDQKLAQKAGRKGGSVCGEAKRRAA